MPLGIVILAAPVVAKTHRRRPLPITFQRKSAGARLLVQTNRYDFRESYGQRLINLVFGGVAVARNNLVLDVVVLLVVYGQRLVVGPYEFHP